MSELRPPQAAMSLDAAIQAARDAQRAGSWDDALAGYRQALASAREADSGAEVADILRWIAQVHRERGELDAAAESAEQSRQVAEAAGLRDRLASALNSLAAIQLMRGELDDAATRFALARPLAVEAGPECLVSMIDMNLGIIANIRGDVELALASYGSALAGCRRLGDERSAVYALNNLGMAHVDLEQWDEATAAFARAAELAGRVGEALMVGRVALNHAELHLKRQQYEAARERVESSLGVFRRLGARASIGEAYKFYGILCRETGRPEQARTYFDLSLDLAEASQNRLLQAETHLESALLHLERTHEAQEGILQLNRSLILFRNLRANREVLDIERRLERFEKVYLPALRGWEAGLTGATDPVRAGHAHRVAGYATRLASEVGIAGWELTWVRVGALIHDVGHSALPAEVRHPDDWIASADGGGDMHPIVGASLAGHLEFPDEVRAIVRGHHERWAGTGYPDRLAGDAIPLGARIVGIADAFDDLTNPGFARDAYTQEEGLQIMEREMGTAFDPALLRQFRAMLAGV